MNFALLGDDRAVLPLIRAIGRHQDHRVECAAMIGSLERELLRGSRSADIADMGPDFDRE